MASLPSGTITFLMTDIEGSTRLWEQDRESMKLALERHDTLAQEIVERRQGQVVKSKGEGDSLFAVFGRASNAALAALELQRAFSQEHWPGELGLKTRMALHTGEAELRGGDYFGSVVNRCARVRGAAHGGQILMTSATCELALQELGPNQIEVRDLGTHRLKDLLRPEHIHQAGSPGQLVDFPPLRTLNLQATNLPVQLTSFVGRESEIEAVARLLERARIVTLLGPGGCGKTRLALQVAAEQAEAYEDGLWFSDLTTVSDRGGMTRRIADVLKLAPGPVDVQRLADELQGKILLLILDNCEQVCDDVAQVSHDLVLACPALSILATSREPLKVPGEARYPVPPLGLPAEVDEDPEALTQYGAIRLFCDRALERQPSFLLDAINGAAVLEICRRLDGMPLAIEQTAASVAVMAPAQILKRWKNGFPQLAADDRSQIPRHQTLRACIDWSFELLEDKERELLARLSVFAAGWSLEAAEAVCSDESISEEEILPLLGNLVDRCMVAVEVGAAEHRYRFLEVMRVYAGEKLAEPAAVEERLVDWAIALAAEADPELIGPHQSEWLERIDLEYPNLVKSLAHAEERWPQKFFSLTHHLRRYWFYRARLHDGVHWLERALAAAPEESDEFAECANALGALYYRLNQNAQARQYYQVALTYWSARDRTAPAVSVLANLAMLEVQEGNAEQAIDHFEQAVVACRGLSDGSAEAKILLNYGRLLLETGNLDRAAASLERCIEIMAAEGKTTVLATAYGNLGACRRARGDRAGAASALRQSFDIWVAAPEPTGLVSALLDLADLCLDWAQARDAARLLGLSDAVAASAEIGITPQFAERRLSLYESLKSQKLALNEVMAEGWVQDLHEAARYGLECVSRLDQK
jgi:predicted ATPase/class 3 adenylate cyclase